MLLTLTRHNDGVALVINFDHMITMFRDDRNYTVIDIVAGGGRVRVRETPDQIMALIQEVKDAY